MSHNFDTCYEMSLNNLIFVIYLIFSLFIPQRLGAFPLDSHRMKNSWHLVVLCNGLMGSSNDLTYLAQKLRDEGYLVLQSKANELQHSLLGIADGAKKLKEEVLTVKSKNPKLERISLIGNSLGGLFARYAVMLLFDETSNTMHGLIPESFMVGFLLS